MFVNINQFKGQIYLPKNECLDNETFILEMLRIEEDILINLLGWCLFEELKDTTTFNIQTGYAEINENTPDHIIWLVNGLSYENTTTNDKCGCGCNFSKCDKRKWGGLIRNVEVSYFVEECGVRTMRNVSEKFSFLSYFVYANYVVNNSANFMNGGVTDLSNYPNSQKIDNAYISFYNHIKGCGRSCDVPLTIFLNDKIESFPKWESSYLCNYKKPNVWGLH